MTVAKEDENETGSPPLGFVALGVGSLLVLIAAAVFVWSGVLTASGRIAATTRNESSLLTAADIDLVVDAGSEAASTGLLIDAAGLYPGLQLERCFEVTYFGNTDDVAVRLFGRPGGGTGLEAFINTTVDVGTGTDEACADFTASRPIFDDTLLDLWNRHGSFDAGLVLLPAAADGESTWVRIGAEVLDTNDAQDLTTAFWLVIEARP